MDRWAMHGSDDGIARSVDAELVRRALAGDKRAESKLLQRHLVAVRKFFRRSVRDPFAVEDLTQETMLACLLRLRTIEHPECFGGWLIGIASNKLKDYYRESKRARRRPGRLDAPWAVAGEDADTPFCTVAAEHDKRMLAELLDQLPLPTKQLLLHFYWDELGRSEVGEILGIPPGTVGSRLCYARKQLRARLATHCLR
jgi:RNA polymerase sigma-70 factor (ECF subfamily)